MRPHAQGQQVILVPVYNMLCRMCSLNMTAERAAWLLGSQLTHIVSEHYAHVTAEADKDTGFLGYHFVGDPSAVRMPS